jgi:predicted amidophosphoribosyltransferase
VLLPPSLPVPPGLVSCRAVAAYDAEAREVLTALKNRGERARVTALATDLAALVPAVAGLIVTWAPTGTGRRRARGFDQAELLARALARRRGLPVASLLRRLPGPAQAGRSSDERRVNPRFAARRRVDRPVLIVDDIATTGATLSAAASALRSVGVPEVHGLVVARAPRPGEQ